MVDSSPTFAAPATAPRHTLKRRPSVGVMNALCPWDRWLNFRCPQAESTYMRRMHERASGLDKILYIVGIVAVALAMLFCEAIGWAYLVHQLGYLIIMGIGVGLLWLLIHQRGPYARGNAQMRLNLLSWLRLLGSCLDMIATMAGADPAKVFTTNQTLLRIATHASIGFAVLEGLAMGFPFKQHLVVHGGVSLIRMSWILQFQSECNRNEALADAMNEAGHWIEEGLSRLCVMGFLSPMRPPLSGEYPCWLVGYFWHVSLEFLLPTLALFVIESKWRIEHLISMGMPHNVDISGLRMFFLIGVIEKLLIGTIGMQVSWFILKALANMELTCKA